MQRRIANETVVHVQSRRYAFVHAFVHHGSKVGQFRIVRPDEIIVHRVIGSQFFCFAAHPDGLFVAVAIVVKMLDKGSNTVECCSRNSSDCTTLVFAIGAGSPDTIVQQQEEGCSLFQEREAELELEREGD